ncbi:MAG: MFS transporter [Mariprofundus sp.]|nr:MFS transporter [Mariprofundus sp.]
MVTTSSLNHIRLFYAAYFAAMGLILPYFPVYLEQIGLSAVMIGMITGLLAAAKVIAPPWLGHHLNHQSDITIRRVLVAASLLAALFALLLGVSHQLFAVALVTLLFGTCWAVILPLTDGLSVSISEAALADYGRLRVWGSLGFVLTSFAGGAWLMENNQITTFPWLLALLMLITAFATYGFPSLHSPTTAHDMSLPLLSRPFVLLLILTFIMQLSHGAYYGFFSLYLAQAGYSGWQIGLYWVVGVLAEMVLMWLCSRPLQQISPAWLFTICMVLAALRWFGTAITTDMNWLIALQLLHAASFAAFHVAAVVWVKRFTPDSLHAAAQGWYSALGFGLGGCIGIMGCGWIVELYGFSAAFYSCAAIALLGIPFSLLLPGRHLTPNTRLSLDSESSRE